MASKRRRQALRPSPSAAASASMPSRSTRPTGTEAGVNEILAGLRLRDSRRANAGHQTSAQDRVQALTSPSIPPSLSDLLDLPQAAPPAPRRGLPGPAGPPPPRSGFYQSRLRGPCVDEADAALDLEGGLAGWRRPLPGGWYPQHGSLSDMVLRRIAADWSEQRQYHRFHLYTLPSRLRSAVLHYVSLRLTVSKADLKLVLDGPPVRDFAAHGAEKAETAGLNDDVHHLDLTSLTTKRVSVSSLGKIVDQAEAAAEDDGVQESWDTAQLSAGPVKLLPNLTHLSLAIPPGAGRERTHFQYAAWGQLLRIAPSLPTLTHLNLSGWPSPALSTQSSEITRLAVRIGPEAHHGHSMPTPDPARWSSKGAEDWTETVSTLRRLSKLLYGLEYLNLTGCGDWFAGLRWETELFPDFAEHCARLSIDWAGDWGKVVTLRLRSGQAGPARCWPRSRLERWRQEAGLVEMHIVRARAGLGRIIKVERDEELAVVAEGTGQASSQARST